MQNSKRLKEVLKKNYKWIVLSLCLTFLLFLIEDVVDNDIILFDETIYNLVANHLIKDSFTSFFKLMTNFANMYWLIGLAIILLLSIKNRSIGKRIILNLGTSALTNYIIKLLLQRPRPIGNRIIEESGYSFPSGHSMVSMAFYGYLIYLIITNVKNTYIKILLTIILSILILCVGISRVYLGVHYASDVLAGFLVGIIYLIVFVHVTKT